jgi:phosphoglycolate phosphatase-like HAD superfamily hydrolase
MILDLAAEFGFDPARTYFIGDTPKDLMAAHNAGCPFVLVLSGYTSLADVPGLPHPPSHVCAHLGEAVDWILEHRL